MTRHMPPMTPEELGCELKPCPDCGEKVRFGFEIKMPVLTAEICCPTCFQRRSKTIHIADPEEVFDRFPPLARELAKSWNKWDRRGPPLFKKIYEQGEVHRPPAPRGTVSPPANKETYEIVEPAVVKKRFHFGANFSIFCHKLSQGV